jgi:GNAT superfamily N-acetyltransferase
MTTPVTIKTATAVDEAATNHLLALAFGADPAARWAWPHPTQYLMHFPAFVKAFGGRAFSNGTAYYIDGYAGAALWLPPHVHPDEDAVIALIRSTVAERIQTDVLGVLEQMDRYHPTEPHWYLPVIGVDPLLHGQGFGSALMQQALDQCDRGGTPAYLESSNPRNIPFYQRQGFEGLGTIQVGTSPSIVPMVRRPR